VAETYLDMLEIKLEKFRGKSPSAVSSLSALGDIDETVLKKAEISKCNEYTIGALRNFAHFTLMYSKSSTSYIKLMEASALAANEIAESPVLFLEKVSNWACKDPDEGLIV
jgi:hypothetical protein